MRFNHVKHFSLFRRYAPYESVRGSQTKRKPAKQGGLSFCLSSRQGTDDNILLLQNASSTLVRATALPRALLRNSAFFNGVNILASRPSL